MVCSLFLLRCCDRHHLALQVLFLHSPVLAGMQELQLQKNDETCRYQSPLECKADTVGLMLLEVYRAFQHNDIASSYSGFTAESVKDLVSTVHMLGLQSLLIRAEGWLVENKRHMLSGGDEYGSEASTASKIISWMKFACHFQLDRFREACEDVIARTSVGFCAKHARAELEELSPKVFINIAIKSENDMKESIRDLHKEVADLRPQEEEEEYPHGYDYSRAIHCHPSFGSRCSACRGLGMPCASCRATTSISMMDIGSAR